MSPAKLVVLALSMALLIGPPMALPAEPVGTAFTYQGCLKQAGSRVTDTCDFQFSLWDAATTPPGVQVGTTLTFDGVGANPPPVSVTNGLFTVMLDFGSDIFTGDACWLETAVRCPAGAGGYTILTPRQELTPAPYALALPGLWTQQDPTSPNLIGGHNGNIVEPGLALAGVTIGGGAGKVAGNDDAHPFLGAFATVGGGLYNNAQAAYATVGGGHSNTASGGYATVGGGYHNTASGQYANQSRRKGH